jgi:hypothetical protein
MILSRNRFFLLFALMLLSPLVLYKLIWLYGTRETTGTLYFTGHGNLGSVLGISTYPVIWFKSGRDTVYFNGNVNIPLKENEKLSVRYKINNPADAKVNSIICIWGDTLAYELGPLLIFLIIYFHPDLVPKRTNVLIGKKPFLQIVGKFPG